MKKGYLFYILTTLALVFSGCGGGGGGSSSGSSGSTGGNNAGGSTSEPNTANVALGPIANASVTLYTLDGTQVYRTNTNPLGQEDLVDRNGQQFLASYDRLQVGKFVIPASTVENFTDEEILHIVVNGGTDVDPDDDGIVDNNDQPQLNVTLEAFVKVADIKNGSATINAFTTLAIEFLKSQNISDINKTVDYLNNFAKNIFGENSDFTDLYKFNPAKHSDDGSIIDLTKLKNPDSFTNLLNDPEFSEHFFGNCAFQDLTDDDVDRIPRLVENMLNSDDASKDSDADGINDYSEIFSGTEVTMPDVIASEDQLFKYQWHLKNTGQNAGANNPGTPGIDLNVTPLWDQFSGNKQITVAVIDTGIEANHTDFTDQIDFTKSYRYSDGSHDPTPDSDQLNNDPNDSAHGTACAGIIAAKSNNGIGVKGVAPDVTLAGLNVFSSGTNNDFYDALSREANIFSNNWGVPPSSLPRDATFDDIFKDGANNLQKIYLFAAGNERYTYGNSNYQEYLTTPYVIPVAALDANGSFASYSNFGANVLVTAPAGEFGVDYPAIVTTDLSGRTYGLDTDSTHFDVVGNEDGNYTNRMNGTSSACPCVSGVVALMLDANKNLDYRDVRYILAHTARRIDSQNSQWSQNGAGLWFNPNYGFGLVDAYSAVMMAKDFQKLPPLIVSQDYIYDQQTAIPDNDSNGISFDIAVTEDMTIEYVNLWIDLDHTFVGDLEITLTSPAGTTSKLAYQTRTQLSDSGLANWRFGSVQFMDEPSRGTWRVTIKDLQSGDTGTFNKATLRIYGH